jgi:hypothetical protein
MRVFFLILGIVLGTGATDAYQVVPRPGESALEAQERVLQEFISELEYLKLNSDEIRSLKSSYSKIKKERRMALRSERWPSFFETILTSQEPWQGGPKPRKMPLGVMLTIYSQFLHYEYYLRYQPISVSSRTFREAFEGLKIRAESQGVLGSLRDESNQKIIVTTMQKDKALEVYCLEEVIQFLLHSLKSVVEEGQGILFQNWNPAGFWSAKLGGLGGRIVANSTGVDLEGRIFAEVAGKSPVFILGEKICRSETRVQLSRVEAEFFLRSFLPLVLPTTTNEYVKRLNRKFAFREQLRSKRKKYLETLSLREREFEISPSTFLTAEDIK